MDKNRQENLLRQCEAIIKEGLNSMHNVDRALSIINDLGLYNNKNYKSFESYCQENWHIDHTYTHLYLKKNKD